MPQLDFLFYFNVQFFSILFIFLLYFFNTLQIVPLFGAIRVLDMFVIKFRLFKELCLKLTTNRINFSIYYYKVQYYVGPVVNGPSKFSVSLGFVKKSSLNISTVAFKSKSHLYQIVGFSAWPILVALVAGWLLLEVPRTIYFFNWYLLAHLLFLLGFLIVCIYYWVVEVSDESLSSLAYTTKVEQNILGGMALFILSEVMLFFAFFWAFFYSSAVPSIFVGGVWPPINVVTLSAWKLPFLNTILLLSSGVLVNWSYFTAKSTYFSFKGKGIFPVSISQFYPRNLYGVDFLPFLGFLSKLQTYKAISMYFIFLQRFRPISCVALAMHWYWSVLTIFTLFGQRQFVVFFSLCSNYYLYLYNSIINRSNHVYEGLLYTLILGFVFLCVQVFEYTFSATYSFATLYGTLFFLTTGLHGVHVLVGVTLLTVVLLRYLSGFYWINSRVSLGFTTAVWYWHFVDVVWLFLFIFVYVWGG